MEVKEMRRKQRKEKSGKLEVEKELQKGELDIEEKRRLREILNKGKDRP